LGPDRTDERQRGFSQPLSGKFEHGVLLVNKPQTSWRTHKQRKTGSFCRTPKHEACFSRLGFPLAPIGSALYRMDGKRRDRGLAVVEEYSGRIGIC